jgi:hypothetical protein
MILTLDAKRSLTVPVVLAHSHPEILLTHDSTLRKIGWYSSV